MKLAPYNSYYCSQCIAEITNTREFTESQVSEMLAEHFMLNIEHWVTLRYRAQLVEDTPTPPPDEG